MATTSKEYTVSDKVVVVDVSEKPATSKIVREGYDVPAVTINKSNADFFISQLPPLTSTQSPKVVIQSIAAGTKVVVGTAVDITLAPPDIIPATVIDNLHADLAEANIATLTTGALNDSKTRQILLKYDKSENVAENDRSYLEGVLKEYHNVSVDDADPERTFDRAYTSMKSALAYR